jgi:hypothetical protein
MTVLAGQTAQAFPEGSAMNEGRAINRAGDDAKRSFAEERR